MDKPTTQDMLLATAWLEHHGSTWAWDDLNDLIQSDPVAAWKIIQVMVAYAPDYATLAAVAAGPVEDLLSVDEDFEPMRREAEASARFRICLSGAYGLPDDLQRYADERSSSDQLPRAGVTPPIPSADQLTIAVGWFHHSDTHWATTFLDEQIKHHPDDAWRIVRLLLWLSDNLSERRHDVFLFAVEPFVRQHLETHRGQLIDLARGRPELRSWFVATKRPPVENHKLWNDFIVTLSSA
jgi:hypothetical protein